MGQKDLCREFSGKVGKLTRGSGKKKQDGSSLRGAFRTPDVRTPEFCFAPNCRSGFHAGDDRGGACNEYRGP